MSKKSSVIGQFTGKCCDSNVFNLNDMHLAREVFETLIASDEYKRAMENRHYIGFLGHPEDPGCQDFQQACIVMTDQRLLDNGEVEGDFDLIDTPVGRVVKAFIDAGVKFGISIRGSGEVDYQGEVDPNEFIFRGYDLVTFPAFEDCIPEYKDIAASTDTKKLSSYKKICASINANLDSITSCETLSVMQEQFKEGSEPYTILQERIDELNPIEEACEDVEDVQQAKIDAMTTLYLDAQEKVRDLETALAASQEEALCLEVECSDSRFKYSKLKKIVANQLDTARELCEDSRQDYIQMSRKLKQTTKELSQVKASLTTKRSELREVKGQLDEANASNHKLVNANNRLHERLSNISAEKRESNQAIKAAEDLNLKYQRKIKANSETISEKDSTIEDLESQLHETVVANKKLESEASNLDDQNKELLSRVEAAEEMVFSYQQAYANIYANALGVYLKDLPITATTSVEELRNMISAGTSTAGIPASAGMMIDEDEDSYEDDSFDGNFSAEMVTL